MEQLADRFGTVVFKLLPDIADALLAHAAEGLDANVAAKLTDTARLLREEAAVRAEIALENFVGIDLGSMSEESSLPVTVTDLASRWPAPTSACSNRFSRVSWPAPCAAASAART